MEQLRGESKRLYRQTRIINRAVKSEELSEQLLPGIQNDITVGLISPKLSWKDFHILSSLSRGWQQAIQSRLHYDARVRSHSTETLVVLINVPSRIGFCPCPPNQRLTLYSPRDKFGYGIPPIPNFQRGIPEDCQCVTLDGKIYVLGGHVSSDFEEDIEAGGRKVFVLDLAGRTEWKECASMQKPRYHFAVGVSNEKIYVFGGKFHYRFVRGSEMYDPKLNVWSQIKPLFPSRYHHRVAAVGEELYVHGGLELEEDEDYPDIFFKSRGLNLEIYNPIQDQWRSIKHIATSSWDSRHGFVAQGKVHVMDQRGIFVYDLDKRSWTPLRPSCFLTGARRLNIVTPYAIVAVDDELLVVATGYTYGFCLLRTTGFTNKNKEIVWEIACCSASDGDLRRVTLNSFTTMCTIQL